MEAELGLLGKDQLLAQDNSIFYIVWVEMVELTGTGALEKESALNIEEIW